MECAVYARISADLAGKALGVQRQVEDCTAKAKAMGWNVTATYVDNDLSASKNVVRPDYNRLMADIASGAVKALVVYDLDRLTRKPAELEDFINLSDATGVALANVSGDVDLSNSGGRLVARIKGAVARQEAERIAERTARQKAQKASQGIPLGGRHRVFGYDRDWNLITDEAAVVVEVFERAASGEAQRSITADLQSRGIKTVTGGTWTALTTSRLIKRHLYAGKNYFKGAYVGPTAFDALVDEATFEAAQSDYKRPGTNARKHLLSGFAVCGECKAPMSGTAGTGKARYRCDPHAGGCGRLSIACEPLDTIVNAYMSQVQTFPENVADAPDHQAAIDAIDQRIADIQASVELSLADQVELLKTARAERGRLVKEQAATSYMVRAEANIASYVDADLSVKRAAIGSAIKHLFIHRAEHSRTPVQERVTVLLTTGRHLPLAAIDVNDWSEGIPEAYED